MNYEILEELPTPEDFVRLREVAGLPPRSMEAARKGLPNTLYAVVIKHDSNVVGMGRVIGDGGLNFEIVDMAIEPEHQGQGLGSKMFIAIMDYIKRTGVPSSLVTLLGDVPEFYEKFGFVKTSPNSEGMVYRVGQDD